MENSKEQGKKKVSEEDLSTISGGCGHDPKKDGRFKSKMKCENCGYWDYWDGDWGPRFENHYECPECKKYTLCCVNVEKII